MRPPLFVNSDAFVNTACLHTMCHLNAHGMTPINTGGARGLNAALRSSLCGPFFTSVCEVHTHLSVYKHPRYPTYYPPANSKPISHFRESVSVPLPSAALRCVDWQFHQCYSLPWSLGSYFLHLLFLVCFLLSM